MPKTNITRMGRLASGGIAVLWLVCAAGCARESYRPSPLEPETTQRAYESRTLDGADLREALRAQGEDVSVWPRVAWSLPALTAVALHHHPEIALARARAKVAGAEKATSTTRVPYTVTGRPEYNGKSGDDIPWGLGVLVGFTIDVGGKRDIRTEQLARLEEAAQLEIAVTSWRVRSRLRRHFVDLHVATRTAEALEAEQAERLRLVALMEKRAAVGYASSNEAGVLRLRAAEGELAVARAAVRRDQALAGVAEAAGVPLAVLETVRFDFGILDHPMVPPAAVDVRRVALRNRIDLRRKLADYAAAEAAVKLEVARQYPDVTLVPGYFWDADESIWSISFFSLLTPQARARALIREAEARREVEEKAFNALQAAVIAEASAAASRYRHAFEAHRAARRQIETARSRHDRVREQFDLGHADRVELAQAKLEAAMAERLATISMLELQQGLSALEDAVQRPLDNPDLATTSAPAAAPAGAPIDPALLDND
jgi:cobalt-zinc-cadmium efflux system outer membrane protein